MPSGSLVHSSETGIKGEEIALGYLKKNGFKLLEQNWRTRRGEVDLITEKDKGLYFVEVKFRRTLGFGRGEEAVNLSKQKKMALAALDYIQKKVAHQRAIHFAALVIDGSQDPQRVEWIEFPLDLPLQYY